MKYQPSAAARNNSQGESGPKALSRFRFLCISLKRGYVIFLCIGCEFGQLIEAMNNDILTIGQNDGLPCVLLAQPATRTLNWKVLVKP
jgi:hypothetical protein